MKKILIFSFLLFLSLSSCEKAEEIRYIGETCVVFGTKTDTLSNIVYSFLENPQAQGVDTILIPVRVFGNRAPHDRPFKVAVVTALTTAVTGTHYLPLNTEYVMPADSGLVYIPMIIKNEDPSLSVTPVTVGLRLDANEHFGSFPRMQSVKVTFSNTIKQPSWWQYWMNSQNNFPKFSATAYSLVTMVTGRSNFETSMDGDMSLFYISVYSMLYVWSPFYNSATAGEASLRAWMDTHPGWVLTKHTGDAFFDFYKEESPLVKFRYGPVASGSSVYGFFDENGVVIAR